MRHFPTLFIVFLAAGYLLRPTPVWAFGFYAAVLPWTVVLVVRDRAARYLRDPGLWIGLATIGWFTLSVTWGVNQTPERVHSYIRGGITNGVFLVAGLAFHALADRRTQQWLVRALSLVGLANAVIALSLYLATANPLVDRLSGWAETRHEILGADVMMIALVMTVHALFTDDRRSLRAAYVVALLAQVLFVLLTGSRGPFLVLAAAVGVYLMCRRPVLALIPVALCVAAVAAIWLLEPVVPAAEHFFTRDSYRLAIWSVALDRIADRPWFGHGVATVASFGPHGFTFPHSLYLSALFYGGAIGLALLVAFLGYVVWRAAFRADSENRPLLLSLLMVPLTAGLTDIGQPIKSPSELWYILWLPIIVALGRTQRVTVACSRRAGWARPVPGREYSEARMRPRPEPD